MEDPLHPDQRLGDLSGSETAPTRLDSSRTAAALMSGSGTSIGGSRCATRDGPGSGWPIGWSPLATPERETRRSSRTGSGCSRIFRRGLPRSTAIPRIQTTCSGAGRNTRNRGPGSSRSSAARSCATSPAPSGSGWSVFSTSRGVSCVRLENGALLAAARSPQELGLSLYGWRLERLYHGPEFHVVLSIPGGGRTTGAPSRWPSGRGNVSRRWSGPLPTHVPYYRGAWRDRAVLEVRSAADLPRLPLLDRQNVRRREREFLDERLDPRAHVSGKDERDDRNVHHRLLAEERRSSGGGRSTRCARAESRASRATCRGR